MRTNELTKLRRLMAMDTRKASYFTAQRMVDAAKDYTDSADRIKAQIDAIEKAARTRLTGLVLR